MFKWIDVPLIGFQIDKTLVSHAIRDALMLLGNSIIMSFGILFISFLSTLEFRNSINDILQFIPIMILIAGWVQFGISIGLEIRDRKFFDIADVGVSVFIVNLILLLVLKFVSPTFLDLSLAIMNGIGMSFLFVVYSAILILINFFKGDEFQFILGES